MRLIPLLLLFIVWLSPTAHGAAVIRIVDGDTIVLSDLRRVRLYGVDCPERGQPGEALATGYMESLTLGQTVSIEEQYQDRFGRTVAIVRLESGITAQEALLQFGAAWVAPRYCKLPQCSEWKLQEGNARLSKAGIWAEPEAVPPWTWRKRAN